jgi:hypothetical protein
MGAVLFAALVATTCGDRPEVFYPHAAEAQADGAIDRGWVPGWMPKSARDLHEVHDLDTNKSMLMFAFDANDAPNLSASCRQVSGDDVRPVPFRKAWWHQDVPPRDAVTRKHSYYHCADGSYVAVSAVDRQLYHWRP